jgi:hypothetical protein
MEERQTVRPATTPFGRETALEVVEEGGAYRMKRSTENENRGRAFQVTITETLKRKVTVYETELKEATPDEAAQLVSDWWHNSQIILEAEDFADVEFPAEEMEGTPEEMDEFPETGIPEEMGGGA